MKETTDRLLRKLFTELEQNPLVETSDIEMDFSPAFGPEQTAELYPCFMEHSKAILPEEARVMITFPHFTSCLWGCREKNGFWLIGGTGMTNIENSLSITTYDFDASACLTAGGSAPSLKGWHYFDFAPADELFGKTGTLLFSDKTGTVPELFFTDEDRLYPMRLGIERYVEMLYLTKGVFGWQYLFCPENALKAASGIRQEHLRKGIAMVQRLFPQNDYSVISDLLPKTETKN